MLDFFHQSNTTAFLELEALDVTFGVAVLVFETWSHSIALTGLELAMWTKLALNLELMSLCLCLSRTEIKGECHYA